MGKLNEIIKNNAENKKTGSLNLKQFAARKAAHISVCKELLTASKKHSLSMTTLVYLGVSKQAHHLNVAKKGFTSYDAKKVNTIARWLKMFAKHSNDKRMYKQANVAHALCTYYEKVSTKTKDFKAALEKSKPIAYEKNPYKATIKALGI